MNAAARAGWTVLRYDRDMVLDGTAYEEVKAWLNATPD